MEENGSRKRGSRRAYLRDFRSDESGNYTYSGRIYTSALGPDVLRRSLMTAIGVFGAAFVLEIAAGFLPGTGMEGHILMLLPYALGMAATARILWIFFRILRLTGLMGSGAQNAGGQGSGAQKAGGQGRRAQNAGGQGSGVPKADEQEKNGQAACLREYVYEATVRKLPGYLIAVQVFAATALVDAAVCMIRGTYGMRVAPAIVFLLSQMILFAAGAWALRKNPAGEWN